MENSVTPCQKFVDLLVGVEALHLPKGEYAVAGSGPLAIRNIREAHDVDLIVKRDVWEELARCRTVTGRKKNCIIIGPVEIWKDWMVFTDLIDEMIDNSEEIRGFPFTKLSYVVAWKRWMGREKDLDDIEAIERWVNYPSLKGGACSWLQGPLPLAR